VTVPPAFTSVQTIVFGDGKLYRNVPPGGVALGS
jgi:hypothetical protein